MRITRKDKRSTKEFEELTPGAVFEYASEEYLKAYDMRQEEYVAIDLVEGTVCRLDADAEVISLDAELIIRGELK